MNDDELRLLREMRNLAWGWKPNRWLHTDEQALFESVKELLERGGLSAARGGEPNDERLWAFGGAVAAAYSHEYAQSLRDGMPEPEAHDKTCARLRELLRALGGAARGGAPAPPSAEWSQAQALREEIVELREACAQAAATLDNAGAPFGDGTLTLAQRIAGLVGLLESGAGGAPAVPSEGDLLYDAWTVIANAWNGDWTRGSAEWRAAAERWRDKWHATLGEGTIGNPYGGIEGIKLPGSLAPAPSGPWKVDWYEDRARWYVHDRSGVTEHGPFSEAEAVAVRDALNRVARLAVPGEGTKT